MTGLKRYNISLNIEGEEVEFYAFTFNNRITELRCMINNYQQNFNSLLKNDAIRHSIKKQIKEIVESE